ncbi:MAG: UDP-3-O-(3-hydroxymyristoyl)glucosamine N-acyltransferase [Rhizobiales bacterium]|nr:UDP-3-O-(3-hydroxymyristoyl)glucosamine N-acyltransferase [Hyphomicrobiales bacterium]
MSQPTFFKTPPSMTLAELAALTGAVLADPSQSSRVVRSAGALDRAGPAQFTFCEHRKYLPALQATHAGACLVNEKLVPSVPSHVAALTVKDPYRAFVAALRELHKDTLKPSSSHDLSGIAPSAVIHPSAELEDGVTVDPLAVIGPNVEIGYGTVIGASAVIGANVRIGRDCSIGAGASVTFALIGNDVIIHPGCRIGQDGFGYLPGARGHLKIPQAGRVIIQNNVEIGAGTTVDRGALNDTVIGEGSKIDNLVQIGHNVTIGRHCIVVSQSGIAGSSTLGDGVVLGARIGVSDHATIGDGAQIAARSSVVGEVPPGVIWGGSPAKPIKQFFRELFAVERLGRESAGKSKSPGNGDEGQT